MLQALTLIRADFRFMQRSLLSCYLLVELSTAEVVAVVILEGLLEWGRTCKRLCLGPG